MIHIGIKKIGTKLILAFSAIVLFSVFMVSVPILTRQIADVKENTRVAATNQMESARLAVESFLAKPYCFVKDTALYVKRARLQLEQTQKDFETLVDGDPSIICLYYADEVPMNKGGMFYSGDGWVPDSDYDKYSRDWFKDSMNKKGVLLTEPYVDETTKELVTTVSTAVYRDNGSFAGVVGVDIFLKTLNSLVEAIKLTEGGKSYILDMNGVYLTNDDLSKVCSANFFEDYSILANYKNRLNSEVFVETNAVGGYYIASQVVSKDAGWVLVTVGRSAELFKSLRQSMVLIAIMAVITVIISLGLAFVVSSRIVNPITIVDKTINGIASGNADLTKRIEVTSRDEIGSLVGGFNSFAEKLQSIISEVKDSKEELREAGDLMTSNAQDTAASITQIIANIESMNSQIGNQSKSVDQTAAAVNEIASNIESLEKMIETQSSGVTQASAAVEEMIGNISSVNQSVEKMAASFKDLETNTQSGINKQQAVDEQIKSIEQQSSMLQEANAAISSIAEQTNLLAMNAAIEAAHAGEAGKGFAVVADEIRKLSETSTQQSKTIGEQLNNIQNSIVTVVQASADSNQAFSSVSQQISDTDELITQIKSAMQEQQEGSKQITDALHCMNDSTSEVRTAATEMNEGNRMILNEVTALQEFTRAMKGSMEEMSIGAEKINETGASLSTISSSVKDSIDKIGDQIDQFRV